MSDNYQTRIQSLITPEFRAQLKRFELQAKRSATGDVIGNYKSAFKGSGIEYADLREYQAGDDVKRIHWKASARAGKTFVKYFEEERTVRLILAVDTSKSLVFGSPSSKQQRILEFAALTSFLARSSGDEIGLISFAGEINKYVPPSSSRSQLTQMLIPLLDSNPEPSTNLKAPLEHLLRKEIKRSIVFLISDFYDEGYEDALKLASKKHELVCVLSEHDNEYLPPTNAIIEYQDAESSGSLILDASSSDSFKQISNLAKAHRENIKRQAQTLGAEFTTLKSSPVRTLQRILSSKIRRTR